MKKRILSILFTLLLIPTLCWGQWSPPGGWDTWVRALTNLGFVTASDSLTLNKPLYLKYGTSPGLLRFYEGSGGGTNYLGFTVGNMAGDTIYTLWSAYPSIANAIPIVSTNGTFSWNDQSLLTTSSPTFAGLALGANNLTMSGALAATGARVLKGWFTDIETTNMPTINGAAITTILQPLDAELTDISAISMAKGYMMYYNGTNTVGLAPLGTNAFSLGMTGTVPTWYWLTASKPVCTDASGLPVVCAGTEGV